MLNLKNPKVAIPIVLIAGIFWSFGPYVVRHIDQPETVPWQYLFTRGIVIFLLLNMYLFLEEGKEFYKNYFKVGISGLIGGIGLGTAMITFIWSITNTTAAITLLCLAAMPFITALLGFLFLKEKIKNFLKLLDKFNDKKNISFPSEWKEFKKIFDKKNYSRKECLTLPINALKKVIQ